MPRLPVEDEIGQHHYRVMPMQTTPGTSLFNDCFRIIGPSIGIVFDAVGVPQDSNIMGDDGLLGQVSKKVKGNDEFFSKAMLQLTQRMDNKTVQSIAQRLAATTKVREYVPESVLEGEGADREVTLTGAGELSDWMPLKGRYEEHFAGDLGQWAKWMAFALKVQLGPFFSVLVNAANSQDESSSENQ